MRRRRSERLRATITAFSPSLAFQRCTVRAPMPASSQARLNRAPSRQAASNHCTVLWRSSSAIILPCVASRSPGTFLRALAGLSSQRAPCPLAPHISFEFLNAPFASRLCWAETRSSGASLSAAVAFSFHCCSFVGYTPFSRHQALCCVSSIAAVAITACSQGRRCPYAFSIRCGQCVRPPPL